MGWANCGEDSQGRPIGYAHEATCDEPGCTKKIDRGLSYACGGMHGETTAGCEKYFCEEHLITVEVYGDCVSICRSCYEGIDDAYYWDDDNVLQMRESVAGQAPKS